jgi:S-layer homology domain
MRIRTSVVGIIAIAVSFTAGAQSLNSPDRADTAQASLPVGPAFGTSSASILTLPAVTFQLVSGVEGIIDGAAARSCTSDAPCTWLAGVTLPSGSRITQLELEACDEDPASKVSFSLRRHPVPMQTEVPIVNNGSTGIADTPGCALFPVVADHTVDNQANSYVAEVSAAPGTNVRFGAVRVGYQLQVSPAPATATFNDVGTSHPFFQFIEALAASRITAGCGDGKFCPDDPVTRGQMAVFLATALGLSFPN